MRASHLSALPCHPMVIRKNSAFYQPHCTLPPQLHLCLSETKGARNAETGAAVFSSGGHWSQGRVKHRVNTKAHWDLSKLHFCPTHSRSESRSLKDWTSSQRQRLQCHSNGLRSDCHKPTRPQTHCCLLLLLVFQINNVKNKFFQKQQQQQHLNLSCSNLYKAL